MGPERRRRGLSPLLMDRLVSILCMVFLLSTSLTVYLANRGAGYYPVSVQEKVLQDSLTPKTGSMQVYLDPSQRRRDSSHRDESGSFSDGGGETLAGLNCDDHGGPNKEIAKEMVYWEDIPSDSLFVSPFKKKDVTQYLTFEPDIAGWNNVRMAIETVVALAVAMGRTLVLPPDQPLFKAGNASGRNREIFSFNHFFQFDYIEKEHVGFDFITTKEFLEREALKGNLLKTGTLSFPPDNITNWNNSTDLDSLVYWLRNVTHVMNWHPDDCLAVFPSSANSSNIEALKDIVSKVQKSGGFPPYETYVGKPSPVNATVTDRLQESWAERQHLCMYDEELQNARVLHFTSDHDDVPGARLLTHFYSFLFFQDWKHDLWMKRFIRDHLRYKDEIQCAAARVVQAIRDRARARGDPDGDFDSFHIRRGDFIDFANETQVTADEIYEVSKGQLRENATIYIATNECDRSFFDPLRRHYDIVFLSDFEGAMFGLNKNFRGIVEQLVASRGRVFFGCFFSTFTNYINRLRGYHSSRLMASGFENGIINSWYYAPASNRNEMRKYYPVHLEYFEREFPTSWRFINTGVEPTGR